MIRSYVRDVRDVGARVLVPGRSVGCPDADEGEQTCRRMGAGQFCGFIYRSANFSELERTHLRAKRKLRGWVGGCKVRRYHADPEEGSQDQSNAAREEEGQGERTSKVGFLPRTRFS